MDNFEFWICGLLFLIGIGAAFIQRVCGFGLGIFALLFLPHFMPSHGESIALCNILSAVVSGGNAFQFRKKIPFSTVLAPLCAAMITVPVASYFSSRVSKETFVFVLGVCLICLSIYFFFFSERVKFRPTVKNGLLAGALSGTLNGLFSTGGPPSVVYLTQTLSENVVYFAAIQFYFTCTNLYALVFRVINGAVTSSLLLYSVFALVGCLVGNRIGERVFSRLDGARLRKVIYGGMILSGIVMLI